MINIYLHLTISPEQRVSASQQMLTQLRDRLAQLPLDQRGQAQEQVRQLELIFQQSQNQTNTNTNTNTNNTTNNNNNNNNNSNTPKKNEW